MVDHGDVLDDGVAVGSAGDVLGGALAELGVAEAVDAAPAVGSGGGHDFEGGVFAFHERDHEGVVVPVPAPDFFAQVAAAEGVAFGFAEEGLELGDEGFGGGFDFVSGAGAVALGGVALVEEDEGEAVDLFSAAVEGAGVEGLGEDVEFAGGVGAVVFHVVGFGFEGDFEADGGGGGVVVPEPVVLPEFDAEGLVEGLPGDVVEAAAFSALEEVFEVLDVFFGEAVEGDGDGGAVLPFEDDFAAGVDFDDFGFDLTAGFAVGPEACVGREYAQECECCDVPIHVFILYN